MAPIRPRRSSEKSSPSPGSSRKGAKTTKTISPGGKVSPRHSRRLIGEPSGASKSARQSPIESGSAPADGPITPNDARSDSGWGLQAEPQPWNEDLTEENLKLERNFELAQKKVRVEELIQELRAAQDDVAAIEPSRHATRPLVTEGGGEDPDGAVPFSELDPERSRKLNEEREEAAAAESASLLADRQAREALSAHNKLAGRSPEAACVYIPTITMRQYLQEACNLTQHCIYDFGRRIEPSKYLCEWDFSGDVKIEYPNLKYLFGENGLYTKSESSSVKHHYREIVETLVALRNAWAHPGAVDLPGASDPKILDVYLCAVEELACLVGDTEVEKGAERLRNELDTLVREIYDQIKALLAAQTPGQDIPWEKHHQRCFDFAIHCKKSTNATEFWKGLPLILQQAANDWDFWYGGTVKP